MDIVRSYFRDIFLTIRTVVGTLFVLNKGFEDVSKRINSDPGLPIPNPTASFWQEDPLYPELVNIKSDELPDTADVVIIGSGITGASIARTLLRECEATCKVVMLEARQVCSGATGRNGGHIKTSPYNEFRELKEKFGLERARAIVKFRIKHVEVLTGLAKAEGINAECREVETVDLFFHHDVFERNEEVVRELAIDMPDIAARVRTWDVAEARKNFSVGDHVVGAISYPAGAIWPYRFVTSILRSLLSSYPFNFSIEANTPVTSISTNQDQDRPFTVLTDRGNIKTTHVIHATNAHAPHLVSGIRGKLFGMRGQMSAQRPGKSFPRLGGSRSWSLIYREGYDYITQRPGDDGEVMAGGGWAQSGNRGLDEIGIWSDDATNFLAGSHLSGILPMAFGPKHWGEDGEGGRLKSMWTGSIGITADALPFVGRLDASLTGRRPPLRTRATRAAVAPAEWICAGYRGEGMVNAWLCGVALAVMVQGREDVDAEEQPGRPAGPLFDWFPREMLISPGRLRRANVKRVG
ncbi:hypothetical protein GP486_008191 [Trichoglossum hirsutum]|uniref:FAD dependent oxidoreductase domain-containing protein n=1 Tax=Trichoglossum hirsutum TaxID=265104 RepID=A0A9P8IIX0_9PEZI|nr:hypothetical protein GP486_008191 [Trichoglossum hirsutum]